MVNFLMPDKELKETKGPGDIVDEVLGEDDKILPSGDSATQFYLDLLQQQVSDPNKPLGTNFQKVYEVKEKDDEGNVITDPQTGLPKVKEIPAEIFLTSDLYQEERRAIFGSGEAFKNIYYQKDITIQFNSLPVGMRIEAKNLMADAGLINLNKTYGTLLDNETAKGLKLAMDFSMNNNGKVSWIAAVKMMGSYAKANQAARTGKYEFNEQVLNDYVDEILAGAEARKGKPLSDYEKNFIVQKLTAGPVAEFKTDISALAPAIPDQLSYDETTGQTTLIPGTEAEVPDEEILAEGAEEVLDEVFAPREALAQEAQTEDDTFYRIQRNLAGLQSVQNQTAPRR